MYSVPESKHADLKHFILAVRETLKPLSVNWISMAKQIVLTYHQF